jgi:tetratricopeptide (TPR) repeat protein/CHAT domain-containing protein
LSNYQREEYPYLLSWKGRPMFHFRSFAPWILGGLLATVLVPLAVIVAMGVSSNRRTPRLDAASKLAQADRARRLAERDVLRAEVMKLRRAGRLDEVVAAAVTRDLDKDELEPLLFRSDEFEAALRKGAEIVIRDRRPDQKATEVWEAHWALAHLDRRAALNVDQKQRLREAERLTWLQGALWRHGQYAEGINLGREAMEIRRQLLGEDHTDYAESLCRLAELYCDMGDYARAEPMFREAVAINKKALGADHPEYARCLQQLADRYRDMKDYARAEPMYREALAITKNAVGAEQPEYAASLNGLARLHFDMGDYAGAEPMYREALAIEKKALGVDHPDYAQVLDNLALLYRKINAPARAEPMCREALALRKKALGADHPKYAASLRRLADLYGSMGQYLRAEPMLREAVAINKKALGADHPAYAASLGHLAGLYMALGDYARAEAILREVLAITNKRVGADHPEHAASLRHLAGLYGEMGQYPRAEAMLREALAINKKALGADHPEYAKSLTPLAGLYETIGDYARAEPMYREALAINKKALGVDHPEYAGSLSRLAILYETMGDYAHAEPMLREALAITKKALGENHPQYAHVLISVANLYHEIGDYARAEPLCREGLAILKKGLDMDRAPYAASLFNVARLWCEMGDYARAEPLYREALAIDEKILGVDHPEYALGLIGLADLYRAVRDYARAEALYREALATTKKALGVAHLHNATSLFLLAALYYDMGDYARAEPMLREALAITKKALGADHPRYAVALALLAELYRATGDYARAEPMFREALAIEKKAVGENHAQNAELLRNLASLYLAQGDSARAEPLIIELLKHTSTLTRGTSAFLGERQRLRIYELQRHTLDMYLSTSRSGVRKPAELYRHVLDWKGAAAAQPAENRLVRDQPELAPSVEQLAKVRTQLANLALRAAPSGQGQAWRQKLDELREVKEGLEADLARRSAGYRGQKQAEQLGPDEAAAALSARVALVDFFVYGHFNPGLRGGGRRQKEPRLLAFVVRRGRPLALVPLGPAQTIDESYLSWRRALDAPRGGALQEASAELRRLVWEPLRPYLGDARTVLIAPDGSLSYFPFAALPGERPGSYLIEDLAIGYVASGRSAIDAMTGPLGSSGRGLLAVGDVDFQAEPGRPGPAARPPLGLSVVAQRDGFRPLPGTGPEARRACELFRTAFVGQPAELLTRAEPTEAAVKRRLDGGRWRVVHLGTHGFFESPARVAALRAEARREDPLALALKADKPGEGDPDFALIPLLRSGVALAGGGRDPGAGPVDVSAEALTQEDGILTAEEVQALDLRGTELVVLSACETGLGMGELGQGVLGLQRAFQAAGARAVVASLWKVEDAATTVLMEQFYTNLWVKKLPKLEALRQAQLVVLNDPGLVTKRRGELAKERGIGETPVKLPEGGRVAVPNVGDARSDPSLWAAFVLSGDGR